jgi:hypothetical protein
MAFDAFLTTAQAAAALRRCSLAALRQQQEAYRAELAEAAAAEDDQGIQHAGGRLALATWILELRIAAEAIAAEAIGITPIGDAPVVEDARGVIVGRGFQRDAGHDAGRRAAAIQLEDERKGGA